jgi:Bacterial Ig-like domain
MKQSNLLTPGMIGNAGILRSAVATAISTAEIVSRKSPSGKSAAARKLRDFLTDAAARLNTYVDSTVPTVLSRVRSNATTVTLTFSEVLAAGDANTPSPSAFAITGGATITGVRVAGSTVVLTGTDFTVGTTLAYTAPAKGKLKDLGGNDVANFSGALA